MELEDLVDVEVGCSSGGDVAEAGQEASHLGQAVDDDKYSIVASRLTGRQMGDEVHADLGPASCRYREGLQ